MIDRIKFLAWVSWRTFAKDRHGQSQLIPVLAISLGVAVLITAMAVMSGFETTLKKAFVDVSGDVVVIPRDFKMPRLNSLKSKIDDVVPELSQMGRFFKIPEAIMAHNGQVSGVMIQGLTPRTFAKVLDFKSRVIEGRLFTKSEMTEKEKKSVLIGSALKNKLNISVGDEVKVVIPRKNEWNPSELVRQVATVKVIGVLDFGEHNFNSRLVIAPFRTAQSMVKQTNEFSGLILKLKNSNDSGKVSMRLAEQLGFNYYVRDWKDLNPNLFKAVNIEKRVVFLILMVVVIAAAFNISLSILVLVFRKFSTICLLKSLGLKDSLVFRIFIFHGLYSGLIGVITGMLFGVGLCYGLVVLQQNWSILPSEIYTLGKIYPDIRLDDMLLVGFSTLLVTFISGFFPAWRAAKAIPIEGIRYE